MNVRGVAASIVLVLLLAAWAGTAVANEPEHIVVQHILISFKGKTDKPVTRTKKEAKALAFELLDRANAGEDFDKLVKEYTDDSYPGIYKLANLDEPVLAGERARTDMVAKFGDTAFRLDVGEIGVATYNSYTSPYGWHVIKRLE
jgi:parvulin-like peptidyl-prolyl isomerase